MRADTGPGMSRLEQLMWEVYDRVRDNGARIYEGGASVAEAAYLQQLVRKYGAVTIAEIGFNIGFSGIAFLDCSPATTVVSFELDRRRAVEVAKEFVDERYPGRHELVIGDSRKAVPQYAETGGGRFDLVFVDGGHEYETAVADIANAGRLARPGGLVVVDDLVPWYSWGEGPYRAWQEAVAGGLIEPIESVVDGRVVDLIEEPGDRAWATGRFTGTKEFG
jgi:predicted O-methyltransferase YrrM